MSEIYNVRMSVNIMKEKTINQNQNLTGGVFVDSLLNFYQGEKKNQHKIKFFTHWTFKSYSP